MAVSNEEIALAVEKYLKSGSGRAVAEKRLWGELAGLFRIVVDDLSKDLQNGCRLNGLINLSAGHARRSLVRIRDTPAVASCARPPQ